MRTTLLAIILAAASGSANAAGDAIKDGSFESPAVPKGSFQRFEPGDKIGAWTVVGGPVDLVSDSYTDSGFTFDAKKGSQWLNLCADPGEHGGIQQNVHVAAGPEYELDVVVGSVFDPHGPYGSSSKVKVHVGGPEGHTYSFKAARSSNGKQQWGPGSVSFNFGSPENITIEIDAMDLDQDCAIDAVSMKGF